MRAGASVGKFPLFLSRREQKATHSSTILGEIQTPSYSIPSTGLLQLLIPERESNLVINCAILSIFLIDILVNIVQASPIHS